MHFKFIWSKREKNVTLECSRISNNIEHSTKIKTVPQSVNFTAVNCDRAGPHNIYVLSIYLLRQARLLNWGRQYYNKTII